jgi:hypothetical protein
MPETFAEVLKDMGMGDFETKLKVHRNQVVDSFCRYNEDMNNSIAKIATDAGFNDEQIARLVQQSNVQVYLIKYAQTKDQNIRRVEFDLADADMVKKLMGRETEAKKIAVAALTDEQGLQKVASEFMGSSNISQLFAQKISEPAMGSRVLEKIAHDRSMKTRMVKEASDLQASMEKVANRLLTQAELFGEAIIKYAYEHNYNPSEILACTFNDSGLEKDTKLFLIDKIQNMVQLKKEASLMSQKFNMMLKIATKEKGVSQPKLPAITAKDKSINGVDDLVSIARKVQEETKRLKEISQKKDSLVAG